MSTAHTHTHPHTLPRPPHRSRAYATHQHSALPQHPGWMSPKHHPTEALDSVKHSTPSNAHTNSFLLANTQATQPAKDHITAALDSVKSSHYTSTASSLPTPRSYSPQPSPHRRPRQRQAQHLIPLPGQDHAPGLLKIHPRSRPLGLTRSQELTHPPPRPLF